VSVKFDIRGSGMKYTTGDHVGIWPLNPDQEVERFLNVLGLEGKRDQVIDIVSLDPALAKVPTPSPTTYESVLRYYLDISQLASRQAIHSFARFAPSERARRVLGRLGTDRNAYHVEVAEKGLRLAEVLSLAAGDDITTSPKTGRYTTWNVPFSHILSSVPRLQPRFYSISSSSRMYPNEIHVTVVVAKSRPSEAGNMIFGLGSNLLLNLKQAITSHDVAQNNINTEEENANKLPTYTLTGPRNKYHKTQIHHLPIHTRPSKFRLPKSVKIPLILIGPGTVSLIPLLIPLPLSCHSSILASQPPSSNHHTGRIPLPRLPPRPPAPRPPRQSHKRPLCPCRLGTHNALLRVSTLGSRFPLQRRMEGN